jgi:hypothetical protein
MLLAIKTLAEANGWTTQRYNAPTDGSPREWIGKGVGLSGTEAIYIGFRCYHSVSADYYNMAAAVFSGYVSANTWENQPGLRDQALCAHNQRIDYWLAVNAQRILLGMKVGTPVYEVGYAGKYFPYATPGQYPYPVAVIGTLGNGTPATRYSDTSAAHSCGAKGLGNGYLRDLNGTWQQFRSLPWTADFNNSPTIRRDTGGYYSALKAVLMTGAADNPNGSGNVWGDLDGIRYISGFNSVTENYIQQGGTPVTPNPAWTPAQADAAIVAAGGVAHFVLQDAFRNGIGDYMLLEMN